MTLDPGQVKSALEGLQGWQVEDGALVRGVPVTDDSREALVEAVANASADSPSSPEVHLQPDLVVKHRAGGQHPQILLREREPVPHGELPLGIKAQLLKLQGNSKSKGSKLNPISSGIWEMTLET